MPLKRVSKRYPKRRAMTRRPRRVAMPNEYAKVTETHEFDLLVNNTAYFDYATSLARCERAASVGRGFQEYKISKVEYHFIPQYDTFAQSGGSSGVPQLYFRIDKTASLRDFTTVSQLVQTGAKPRRMDDKNICISFKPAILQYARDDTHGTNPWAKPLVSPWLSTNKLNNTLQPWQASSIDHLGLAWIVDQVIPPGGQTGSYVVRQRIHYEFRKPIVLTPPQQGLPAAVQAPALNSPEM